MQRLIAAVLFVLVGVTGAVRAQAPEVGEVVDHAFTRPPANAMGAHSLADLRGRPVLIEFWVPT